MASAAVVISLVLLRNQMGEMHEQSVQRQTSIDVATDTSIERLIIAAFQAYTEWPVLRAVFDERAMDVPELDQDMRLRASVVAELLSDVMKRGLTTRAGASWNAGFLAWAKDSIRYSSFLRQWVSDHRSWYPTVFALVQEVEGEALAAS